MADKPKAHTGAPEGKGKSKAPAPKGGTRKPMR